MAALLERRALELLMNADDEAKRHQCEIDYVLSMPTKAERNQYLALVAKARGQAAADRLREAAIAAWKDGQGVAA